MSNVNASGAPPWPGSSAASKRFIVFCPPRAGALSSRTTAALKALRIVRVSAVDEKNCRQWAAAIAQGLGLERGFVVIRRGDGDGGDLAGEGEACVIVAPARWARRWLARVLQCEDSQAPADLDEGSSGAVHIDAVGASVRWWNLQLPES